MKKILAIILFAFLAACGGGGDDGSGKAVAKPSATAGGQVVPFVSYRACETTGPDAPPCPSKQSAGGIQQ